jgi:hypothetical protein
MDSPSCSLTSTNFRPEILPTLDSQKAIARLHSLIMRTHLEARLREQDLPERGPGKERQENMESLGVHEVAALRVEIEE